MDKEKLKQANEKLAGACLIPVTERNFKEKPCLECGKWFKPLYPYMKYCCKSCAKVGMRRKQKEYSARIVKLKSEETKKWNLKHHLCPICGKGMPAKNMRVHFDCMVEMLRKGNRSEKTLRYFWNRGYTLYDMEQLARGEEV